MPHWIKNVLKRHNKKSRNKSSSAATRSQESMLSSDSNVDAPQTRRALGESEADEDSSAPVFQNARDWWRRNGSTVLASAQRLCSIIESSLDGFPIYGPKAAFGAAAQALEALQTIEKNTEKMGEIVAQTEAIANSFVAFTLQVPTAFPSPSPAIADRIQEFNQRLTKAKLSATQDIATKQNIFDRLWDAQRVLEQLESFWREAQFAYNDLIAQTVVSTETKVDRIQHQLLLDSLLPVTSAFHNSSESAPPCLQGTRTQLLTDIQTWMNDASTEPVYWLNGVAGTGKTTIAQSVAIMAGERLAASFFFSRTAESAERRHAAPVIPTLAYQLAQKHGMLCSSICSALQSRLDIRTSRLQEQAKGLLSEPLATGIDDSLFPLPLLVVLDGLDECDKDARSGREGGELVSILLEAFETLPFRIKMFITSRPEPTIRNMFGEISGSVHSLALHRDINTDVLHEDIETYLRYELDKLARRRSIPPPFPSNDDFRKLADRAGTLFIYVRAVVEYISSDLGGSPQEQLADLLQLNSFTSSQTFASLDAVYASTLQKARHAFGHSMAERQQFQDVLACLALVQHGITIVDLAFITDIGQPGCRKILQCLSSLLMYDHKPQDPIRVIHPSFSDFLVDPARCTDENFMVANASRTKLMASLWKRYEKSEDAVWLEEAIKLDHGALVLCPRNDPNRGDTCADLTRSLIMHYDQNGNAALLDEAIYLEQEALALCPQGHPDRAKHCNSLAVSLQRRYDYTGDIALLDEAICLEQEALALCPKGDPDRAQQCNSLAASLSRRYDQAGDTALLDQVIELQQEALTLRPKGHRNRARSCGNLATSLQKRYDRTGDVALFDQIIELEREALALCPKGHPDRAFSCSSLAVSLMTRYGHTGNAVLLDEAIGLQQEALAMRPQGHPDHAKSCGNLAISLMRRYDHTQDMSLLNEVIELHREALALLSKGHPDHATACGSLGNSLQRRYDRTGDVVMLDEMIELGRRALALRPKGHPNRLSACVNLANYLQRRYDRTRDVALLDEMIELGREALILCPKGHHHRMTVCIDLADTFHRRYDHTMDVTLDGEMIELEREALALCPKVHPARTPWRANLMRSLKRLHDHTKNAALLDEVAELEREAAAESQVSIK